MIGFAPEVDGNVAKVDTIAHAQTSVVHEQPPQESEHLTTMHTHMFLQHGLTEGYTINMKIKERENSLYYQKPWYTNKYKWYRIFIPSIRTDNDVVFYTITMFKWDSTVQCQSFYEHSSIINVGLSWIIMENQTIHVLKGYHALSQVELQCEKCLSNKGKYRN